MQTTVAKLSTKVWTLEKKLKNREKYIETLKLRITALEDFLESSNLNPKVTD